MPKIQTNMGVTCGFLTTVGRVHYGVSAPF
jgi:hypothetical protein